jgi:hypothetical protein
MNPERWLTTATGVWWLADSAWTSEVASHGLRTLARSRRHVSLVPQGAPLIQSLSAISHCRMWCRLCGVDPDQASVVTALRSVELRDNRQFIQAAHLTPIERLATWLAVSRLRQTPSLLLLGPEKGLSGNQLQQLIRLILDAAALHRQILIAGSDAEFARACGARSLSLAALVEA